MSHRTNIVKNKQQLNRRSDRQSIITYGPVDIHFHGAFGIDLMSASFQELEDLSRLLWKKGVGGFCATTLSAPPAQLHETVTRLGYWIRNGKHPGARPFGIHLEGPFINSAACGAHPPSTIRPLNWNELERLWQASLSTLKILTIAPENLSNQELKKLNQWTSARQIILSLGHSRATEPQAQKAFTSGFQGVTHAWNALPFHHRKAGVLGAALGNKNIYLELIIDQVHVSPTLIRWTRQLHPTKSICFISDCVPAGGLSKKSKWHSFGDLKIRFHEGACRLKNGELAGGGYVLTESYRRWLETESIYQQCSPLIVLENSIHHLTMVPFRVLGVSPRSQSDRKVEWMRDCTYIPIDSHSSKR